MEIDSANQAKAIIAKDRASGKALGPQSFANLCVGKCNKKDIVYCAFTQMYHELCGISYPGIMWPLPSEARVRSQGSRMGFSNIDIKSVEGMKSN